MYKRQCLKSNEKPAAGGLRAFHIWKGMFYYLVAFDLERLDGTGDGTDQGVAVELRGRSILDDAA